MICLPALMHSPLPQSLTVDFPCMGGTPLACVFWSRFRSQLFLKSVLSFVPDSASRFTCRGPVILLWLLNYLYSIFSFKHDNGVLCFFVLVMVMFLAILQVYPQQVFLDNVQLCYVSMPHLWARFLKAMAFV